jgi:Secretion system C-terminal sorting domain
MKIKHFLVAILYLATQIKSPLHAQNVDIQLRNTGSTLEVWLVPKANYTGIVSNLTFVISWNTAYNVDLAPAGTETVHVPSIPIQVSGNAAKTSTVNGSKKYRVYASGGGNTSISLTNNAAFRIMSVAVPKISTTPTGVFNISNDPYITGNFWNYYFEMGGNDYTGNTSTIALNVPIPLELLTFNAIEKDKSAYLTWKTASEINFSHFEIERSANAKEWTQIGTQKGGNTEGSYFLMDEQAFSQSNVALYRLKMVNTDASFKYSKTVSVEHNDATKGSIKLYPNPTQSDLQLTIDAPYDGRQSVEIIDVVGKTWLSKTVSLVKGQNQQTVDVRALPTGIYFLQLADNKGQKQMVRFIKL